MASTFRGLTFDAYDAESTALFWANALGRVIAPGATPQHAELADDAASGAPRIVFERVPEGRPVRNALHLDLETADLVREAERLVRLGARRLGGVSAGASWVTLTDPEGNAFDLIAA
ncbi:VOC family protein [Actinotalea subterranea]|uniref:VOC family protein n=1 Tax=Actinotalea subterranea TaxID=2607497 RepID=UPI0011EDCE90|nr:VOC family protein [Actinotalea subterranea]